MEAQNRLSLVLYLPTTAIIFSTAVFSVKFLLIFSPLNGIGD